MSERKHYIDNLRWLWIVMLIPFHAAMAFCCFEGNYIWLAPSRAFSSLVVFVSPFYMPLLFVLAGMSAKYAMKRRSLGQFAAERVKKLFIPLVAGTVTVVAVMTYFADKFHNGYSGSFFEHYGVFFTNITDMTGYDGKFSPGHLWFLLYLFIISMLCILVFFLQKKFLPKLSFANIKTFIIPFLIIFPSFMSFVLNFGGKSIGEDFAYFLLGYYILSEENVLAKCTKYHYFSLGIMLLCDAFMTFDFIFRTEHFVAAEIICKEAAIWFGILGFLGLSRCTFNQSNKLTSYMTSRSFLIYIFHFGWLVVLQYYLAPLKLAPTLFYLSSCVGTLILTLATCEIIRLIPGVRLLFGVKAKKKAVTTANIPPEHEKTKV